MRKTAAHPGQIVLFPTGESVPTIDLSSAEDAGPLGGSSAPSFRQRNEGAGYEVVLSGSFRKDLEGLRRIHEELRDLGCRILSPSNVDAVSEVHGFVFMKGEETQSPERLELNHLEAIQKARFVWLYAPDGYVGLSAALEVGFAHAQGIPVFCRDEVRDLTLNTFLRQVSSPAEALKLAQSQLPIPGPNVRAFQRYYKRVAYQRGYERESAQNCLLLMVEEVGELARALRKREKLARHGSPLSTNEAQELADVFLYVVHMANILDLDLGSAVQEKEQLNVARFVAAHK